MHLNQIIEEYVPLDVNVDPTLLWILNVNQATGHPGSYGRRTYRWPFKSTSAKILTTVNPSFQFLYD